MINKAQRGMVSPAQFFFLLFCGRFIAAAAYIRNIAEGVPAADMLLSLAIGMCLTLLFSLPAYYCVKIDRYPFRSAWMQFLYAGVLIYFAALNISYFSCFSSSRIKPEKNMFFVLVLIAVAVGYAAGLGLEGLGRFSLLCGATVIGISGVILLSNLQHFEAVNFYPLYVQPPQTIMMNGVHFAAQSTAPLIFLSVGRKINGHRAEPLFIAVIAAYALIGVWTVVCIGVLGKAGMLYAYPAFALCRMASLGAITRLDVLHTALWVLCMFLQSSLLIFCAADTVRRGNHITKCAVFSGVSAILSVILNALMLQTAWNHYSLWLSVGICVVFTVLLPSAALIGKKRKDACEVV